MSIKFAYQRQHKQRGVARMKAKQRYMKNRNKYKLKAKQRYKKQRMSPAYKRRKTLYRKNPSRFRRVQASGYAGTPFIFIGKDGKEHLGNLLGAICEQEAVVYLIDGVEVGISPIEKFFRGASFLAEEDIEDALGELDSAFGVRTARGLPPPSSRRDPTPNLTQFEADGVELPFSESQWRNALASFARSVGGAYNPKESTLRVPFAGGRELYFRTFIRLLPTSEISLDFLPIRTRATQWSKGEAKLNKGLSRMFVGDLEEGEELFRQYTRFLATLSRVVRTCQSDPVRCLL